MNRRPRFLSHLLCWMLGFVWLSLGLIACDDSSSDDDDDTTETDGDASTDDDDDGNEDGDTTDDDDDGPGCTMVEPPVDDVDMAQKKFALSMFHFNVQYVAGGLEYIEREDLEPFCGDLCEGLDDIAVQDWIIRESFEPVLDLYLAHPTWRGTFEMQAMMVEAIAERFPEVLVKLRQASQSGQVELVSFHYSAQLFMAFPEYDQAHSVERTREIFADHCLPLSGVVFNQEGQAGEGKHDFMARHGYTISVFPKNLFRYVQYEVPWWPLYSDHGVDVIIGPGEVDPESGIEVQWTFFDDGELLSTPLDPYFAFTSVADMEKVAEYEEKLIELENQGVKITSITDYVRQLKGQSVEQKAFPSVVDGTWQPTSTDSILRWMGGRSLAPYNTHERDPWLRAQNYLGRTALEAADILVATAKENGQDTTAWEARLKDAWDWMLMGQVTDASGITPWLGEFYYGLDNSEAGRLEAEAVIGEVKSALGWPYAQINLGNDSAERLEDQILPEAPDETDAPLEGVVVNAPTRTPDVRWYTHDNTHYELHVTFGANGDPTGEDVEQTKVNVTFPRFEDKLIYTPGLMDTQVVSHDFSEYTFQRDEVYLPLANGLIGLGNSWWVVKDCRAAHMAARVPNTEEEKVVQFMDDTADPENPPTWIFHVFQGTEEEALTYATQKNIAPVVYY